MNNEESQILLKKRLAIGLVATFLIACIAIVIYCILTNNNRKVIITNLDSCATDMPADDRDDLFRKLYDFVEAQNQTNSKSSQPHYDAVIRTDSCQNKSYEYEGQKSYTATAILDIESAKQSYQISFNWVKSSEISIENIDLGSVQVSCLTQNELIYGDFNCDQNPLINSTGSDNDPILAILPYFGDGFSLSPTLSADSASGYSIIITYDPPESVYLGGTLETFQNERKQMAENYLESQNIDISRYTFIEKYAVE